MKDGKNRIRTLLLLRNQKEGIKIVIKEENNSFDTLIKVYYNRIIETYAIHRWFIRNYINKIKELEFPKMAKDFINEKCPMLKWNEEEGVWECPCHGSKYESDGTLISEPATTNMTNKSTSI